LPFSPEKGGTPPKRRDGGGYVADIANLSFTVVGATLAVARISRVSCQRKNIKTCFLCYSLVIVNHISARERKYIP